MVAVAALLGLGVVPATAGASGAAAADPGSPSVYVGELTRDQLARLTRGGVDRENIASRRGSAGKVRVEVVLSGGEAAALRKAGVGLSEKKVDGQAASKRMAAQNANGYTVYRSYSEPGGIRDEMVAVAKANPAWSSSS